MEDEIYTYKKGKFELKEWEDVNYCEHTFSIDGRGLTNEEVVDLLSEQETTIQFLKISNDSLNKFIKSNFDEYLTQKRLNERIREYEKLIKQILYETRANYTGRRYSVCVSVSPQMHDTLNNLLKKKLQEEF